MINPLIDFVLTLEPIIAILLAVIFGLGLIIKLLMRFFINRGLTEKDLLGQVHQMYVDLHKETDQLKADLNAASRQVQNIRICLSKIETTLMRWEGSYPPSKEEIESLRKRIRSTLT